jgi:acylaminoacyl-peptidase
MKKREITIEDLRSLKICSDPQISPDGKWVVFTVKSIQKEPNRYFSHLYMGELNYKTVFQFTCGEVNDTQPRWSPEGNEIAFLRKDDTGTQIWQIQRDGGEARNLTKLPEGNFDNLTWSPDGSRILFEFRPTHREWTKEAREAREKSGLSNPPRIITRLDYRREGEGFWDNRKHIWMCSVPSGETTQITDGEYDCREAIWSPDGTCIAYIANRSDFPEITPYKEDIWQLQLTDRVEKRIPSPDGYKWGLSWSPDGDYIAYIGTETRDDPWCTHNDRVWIIPVQIGSPRCLTATLDRIAENITLSDVHGTGNQNPVWSGDSKHLFFVISDRGSSHLYNVNLDGSYQKIIGGQVDICGFSLDKQGQKIAVLASQVDKPGAVFICEGDFNPTTELVQPLVDFNKATLDRINLSKPEEINFVSRDNTDIQGWLMKPAAFDRRRKYPLILYIHGGPAAQYGYTFFHEFQVLAAAGYIVLYTNPRGSLGRETGFATAIQGNWGDLDYQDLMAAVDFTEALPFVDGENMAVVGGSYGGFMTTWIVGNSNRFRCGISERGISNRHSAVGCNDFPPMPDGYWSGNPWNKPEVLWQQSPLRFAESINTPLLIIHSEGDLRCPISQAEQLFSALKKLKREVVFLRYPMETNHGLSRGGPPDLRIDRLHRIVDWLDEHLK